MCSRLHSSAPPPTDDHYPLSDHPLARPTPPLQIGFVALLLVELVAGKGILNLLGVTVGQGLGFEF